MARSVTITVPGTPNACLSLNGRAHWRVKAKHAAAFRAVARYAALSRRTEHPGTRDTPIPPIRGSVMVDYVFGWEKGRKRMDFDNLVGLGKPVLDGVVDSGLLPDDRVVVGMTAKQERDPEGLGFVRVTITEAA